MTYHDSVSGKSLPHASHKLNEKLRVSVGDVQAHELDLRDLVEDVGEVLKVPLGGPGGTGRVREGLGLLLGKGLPLLKAVVLVDASVAAMLYLK